MQFDHVNLVVRDMEAARSFYGDVVGLRETFERVLQGDWIETVSGIPGAVALCVFFEAEASGGRLELLQYLEPAEEFLRDGRPHAPGFGHLAFTVQDIDVWHRNLTNAGAAFISPPVTVPFSVGGRTKRLCYFRDPENNILELAEYR